MQVWEPLAKDCDHCILSLFDWGVLARHVQNGPLHNQVWVDSYTHAFCTAVQHLPHSSCAGASS
eukprot:6618999-Alexandrium_andersonii.AAC.1